jgi:hypothetical protein
MIAGNRIASFAILAVAMNVLAPEAAAAAPLPKPRPAAAKVVKVKTDTRVYLLRGLLNVFSLGMDTLQERLAFMGFEAEVYNHNGWISIANKVAEDRKRGHNGAVVLIGHSLGADVMFQLTERLDQDKIPIRLAVFFDPTISHDISMNVEHVLNLYQLNGFGRKVTAPKGYKGELINMDLSGDESIGHGSIDKSQKLHDLVVAKIMKVAVGPAQRKRKVPAKPKPVASAHPPAIPPLDQPASTGRVSTVPKVETAPAPQTAAPAAPSTSAAQPATPVVPAPNAPQPAAPAPAASQPAAPAAPPPAEAAQVPRI